MPKFTGVITNIIIENLDIISNINYFFLSYYFNQNKNNESCLFFSNLSVNDWNLVTAINISLNKIFIISVVNHVFLFIYYFMIFLIQDLIDIDFSVKFDSLAAEWKGFYHPHLSLHYKVCVGTVKGNCDVTTKTNIDSSTNQHVFDNLLLKNFQVCYHCIIAKISYIDYKDNSMYSTKNVVNRKNRILRLNRSRLLCMHLQPWKSTLRLNFTFGYQN